jgi:hypothetical protein
MGDATLTGSGWLVDEIDTGLAYIREDSTTLARTLVDGAGNIYRAIKVVAEKTAITDGAIQTADQVIGSLSIPAGALKVGDCFRALVTFGRDNNTDAYGTLQSLRMGTAGTVSDSLAGQFNLSSLLPAASGGLSLGNESWWRVVSIGTNSVVENLGVGNGAASWTGASPSGAAVGNQRTLTGYNLTTQAGFFTFTTTMATAVSTRPRTGYMRLETGI